LVKMPFKVYTDPSLELYNALGLYKTSDVRIEGHSKRDGRWTSFRTAVRAAAARAAHNDLGRLGGEFVFGQGYCGPLTIDGMMADLIFASNGRLKSSFVHKMQSHRDRAPIVEILGAARAEVREKFIAGIRSSTSTAPTSEVVVIDMTISGSTPEPPQTPTSTDISFASVTSSTANAFTSSDDEDIRMGLATSTRVAGLLGSEPLEHLSSRTKRSGWFTGPGHSRDSSRGGRLGGEECREDYSPLAGEGLS
jgi:hypothetical protein